MTTTKQQPSAAQPATQRWAADIDPNGLRWPNPSASPNAYVHGPGGLVAIVPPCSNPRVALEAGPEVPDTHDCPEAYEIRDARVHLLAAAPDLLAACDGIVKLLDAGMLVRDTRGDGDPGWAIKQLLLVVGIKALTDATAKARGGA